MTAIHFEATYPAAPQRVFDALTDEAFLDAYAREVGALTHEVRVERAEEHVLTRVAMTVPTAGVPAMFKRLITPTIDLTDVRTWSRHVGEGHRAGTLAVDAAARNRDARVRASLVLQPTGDAQATRFGVDGDVNVNVPLLGEPAAALVKDLVGSVIKRQSAVMKRWLSGS